MRILILKTYAGKTRELEHCQRIARPDTQVDFDNIASAYPITHVHHNYFRLKAIDAVVERALLAEEEGYDGILLACGGDPGVIECRELLNIPVVGTFEAAGHIACTLGHRFSVITTISYSAPNMEELAMRYGFGHKLASVRTLGFAGRELYPSVTPEQVVVDRINEVSRKCVEHDGAEVVVLTATLAGSMFTHSSNGVITASGAPLVDALLAAFKWTEMMVDIHGLMGVPAASRLGRFKTPHEGEYRKLREFYGLPLRRGLDQPTPVVEPVRESL